MNELAPRARWFIFHCRRCRKELWILSFRDTRFCLFASLFLYLFFCHLLDSRNRLDRKGDSSYSGGLLMSKIWWVFFRQCVSDNFFPFSIFLFLFREWHDILKEIEESSLRHGIAVTSSRRGSVTGFFLNRSMFGDFFSIYVGRDNFVISLPSSTAHFIWVPHEFSVLLASCLFIKLQQLFTYFLLTHSEPHTLTLSSASFFLKTLR